MRKRGLKMKKLGGRSAPIMIKVKFLADCGDGKFKSGSVKELKADSAYHWIRRDLAEKYTEKPSKAKKVGRPKKESVQQKVEPKEEKKTEGPLELQSKLPITITDPVPEIEKAPIPEEKK